LTSFLKSEIMFSRVKVLSKSLITKDKALIPKRYFKQQIIKGGRKR